MGNISKNFSYREFTDSETADRYGFSNQITTTEVRDSIKALCGTVLQPLRDKWGKPLYINSGYRSPLLNELVGGVATSQHVKGEAADVCPFGERNGHGDSSVVYELAKMIKEMDLPYDQVILYPSFVHISHRHTGKQRKQILYNRRYNGKKGL